MGLLFSLQKFHSKEQFIKASGVVSSSGSSSKYLEPAANNRTTNNDRIITWITMITIGDIKYWGKPQNHQIIVEPMNPRDSAAVNLSFEDLSWCRQLTSGCSESMIKIAVKLQAWINITEMDSSLTTLHDSPSWSRRRSYRLLQESTAPVITITNWQAHWKMDKPLHFWRNLYFVLSLKQLKSIRTLKKTPNKSRTANRRKCIEFMLDAVQTVKSYGMSSLPLSWIRVIDFSRPYIDRLPRHIWFRY